MVRTKRRQAGSLMALLLGVGSVFACVSGSTPDEYDDDGGTPPECYTNQNCSGATECSGGRCVPVTVCGSAAACAPGEACISGGCRAPCAGPTCANGLVCENGFCVPGQNPMPMGGTGGVGTGASGGTPTGG